MKIKSIKDSVVLNNGIRMPWLGLGVFQVNEGNDVINSVKWALEAGYRSLDTAAAYGNEQGVGKAIRESNIKRSEIFLTTKVWNGDLRKKRIMDAFNESMERLKLDYIDLYLIHWPVKDFYKEAWKVFENIYKSGRVKAIGVSNFLVHHLKNLLANTGIVPAVNQVEFHPFLMQPDLMKFCKEHKIQLEAWSPLMQGQILLVPVVQKLAQKYKKTPVQIVLRWDLQHEVITIPKSVHRDRIISNADIFDFEISEEDMLLLDKLDQNKRVGPDPDNFNF